MLRYKLENFDTLTLQQKKLVYYLSEAALCGRDITFDQFGRYNLKIRKVLELIYLDYKGNRTVEDFKELVVYLKRVWFSSGIYHHYGCDKFVPGFSEKFFVDAVKALDSSVLPLGEGQTVDEFCNELLPVIFDPKVMPVKVNKRMVSILWKLQHAISMKELPRRKLKTIMLLRKILMIKSLYRMD